MLSIILLALNSLVVGTSIEDSLIRVPRLVGGYLTEIEQIPYLVNIRRNGLFVCGGALLTPKCVLTAAHCVKSYQPEDFVVRAGATYLDDWRNSRRVNSIFLPRAYSNRTLEYDIAVFELAARLEGENMDTISLGTSTPKAGEVVKVSGWGLTHENALQPSRQMRSVKLRVFSQSKCRDLYADYRNVSERMFCAAVPGIKDACSADSGGPAVANNGQLVGVVSWGRGHECGRASSPGVYVNVNEVRPWIEDVLNDYCY